MDNYLEIVVALCFRRPTQALDVSATVPDFGFYSKCAQLVSVLQHEHGT